MEEPSPIKQALYTIRYLRQQIEELTTKQNEAIAIIGLGCRFPGNCNSPQSYWDFLCEGKDAISEVPKERWDINTYYDESPGTSGKMYTRHGGFISKPEFFDATFFGISPNEAKEMDPQQRLLLEVAWEALEHAGLSPEELKGSSTGVFMAMGEVDYAKKSLSDNNTAAITSYGKLGLTRSIGIGRIAYVLGLQGPTVLLDTSCSSSLLAVHQACQNLRSGECDLALAGGVNLILSPEDTIAFCALSALSPSGRCKTFDASADGYVRSEGSGIIVLKRLSKAIEDGDNILSVIKGSAVNHDGHSNGLTAPNGMAQQAVITKALEQAHVNPNEIQYVETHGTGTPLGDPIEVSALLKVLGEQRSFDQPLLIGSVKTNIGHLEAAAGIASLIKVVLSIQNKQIPPHLHFKKPNPYILWDALQVEVPTRVTAWPDYSTQRLAGISAFGMSGTNVHMIIGNYQAKKSENSLIFSNSKSSLFLISAKNEKALRSLIEQYLVKLSSLSDEQLPDLCYTASIGRSHFKYRLCFVVKTIAELKRILKEFIHSKALAEVDNKAPEIAFIFEESHSNVTHLASLIPAFKEELTQLDGVFHAYLGITLESLLHGENRKLLSTEKHGHLLSFTTQYALAKVLISWGIKPTRIYSKGTGNFVAACIAGSMELKEALDYILEKESPVLNEDFERNDSETNSCIEINLGGAALDTHDKILLLLALLYEKGLNIDWKQFYQKQQYNKLILPTYPFQRERYWIETRETKNSPSKIQYIYEGQLDLTKAEFLKEHKISGKIIFPAVGYLAHVYEKACKLMRSQKIRFEHATFNNALILNENHPTESQLSISRENDNQFSFDFLFSQTPEDPSSWNSHSMGLFSLPDEKDENLPILDIPNLMSTAHEVNLSLYYQKLLENGLEVGSSFRLVKQIWSMPQAFLGRIELVANETGSKNVFFSNFNVLDACFQATMAFVLFSTKNEFEYIYLPVRAQRIDIFTPLPQEVWFYATQKKSSEDGLHSYQITLYNGSGAAIALVDSLQIIRTTNENLKRKVSKKESSNLYVVDWIKTDFVLNHHRGLSLLNKLSINYIVEAFRKLNWNLVVGQQFSFQEMLRELSIDKRFHKHMERILLILVQAGFLLKRNAEWEVIFVPDSLIKIDDSIFKSVEAEFELLKRCGVMLGDVWQGRVDPLELLFPNGDLNILKRIYQETPLAKSLNREIQKLCVEHVKKICQHKKVRILEIGAGTGSTTAELLPILKSYDISYTFTDISPSFLQKAQERFKEYSFVKYQILDIEQEILEDEFYDIIITANVLHTTKNLEQTLQHVKKILFKGGVLLLAEIVKSHAWLDLTFGLTEGWWRFEDYEHRPNYPLLSSQGWQGLLEHTGFTSSTVHTPLSEASQVVISAYNDKMAMKFPSKHWLICGDKEGLGEHLGKILAKRGDTHSLVYPQGSSAQPLGSGVHTINPNDRESYKTILQKIPKPYAIINLWPLNGDPASIQSENTEGFLSSLYWVQSLSESQQKPYPRLFIITRGAQAVSENHENLEPQSAPIWGLGRSIALEHPDLQCKMIDLDPNTPVTAQEIEEELFSPASENQVAFRNHERYMPSFKKVLLNSHESLYTSKIDQNGTYLITGGLRGLGLYFAKWLLEQGAKSLVLVGRTPQDTKNSEIFKEIEKYDATIQVIIADIAIENDVLHIQKQLFTLPPLKGIIHSAGVLDDGAILEQTMERFSNLFKAKIRGTWNLYRLSQTTYLDFFVLFSSASSVLGAKGQSNHAAANAYLDTFSHYCRQQQIPCLSINWGPWSSIGAAASTPIKANLTQKGFNYLDPHEAIQAFEAFIGLSKPQMIVMSIDWNKFLSQYDEIPTVYSEFLSTNTNEIAVLKERLDHFDLIEKIKNQEETTRLNSLLFYLQEQISQFVGIKLDQIEPQDFLDDLGMDSLVAIELKRVIRTELDVDIPTSKFLQGFSVQTLAVYIHDQMKSTEKMIEVEI
jgi:acyl transferase domain-containing protein/SAM-dependent methyltransferase/acyl carrier protein